MVFLKVLFNATLPSRSAAVMLLASAARTTFGLLLAGILVLPASGLANGNKSGTPSQLDPEIMLTEVYKSLEANRLREAQSKADALVAAFPNFHLGQLVRGDLLLLHTQPIKSFGTASHGPADKLDNLRQEAIVRLKSLRERPDPHWIPSEILQMRKDQKNILLVDARLSRLYVYGNDNGTLTLLNDYYVSQGRLGVNKFKEGDQKTPLGVYYITSRVAGAKLPDFYGTGALPLNYPNEWDKVNGRGGSGIWLHGTPSNSYSRPPLSSDGCVVLTNVDLKYVSQEVQIGNTPVIISEDIKFVSKKQAEADRLAANKMLEAWRIDLESTDEQRLRQHYSRNFKPARGQSLDSWLKKTHQAMLGARKIDVTLDDVTFFRYPGQKNLIVAAFTQDMKVGKGVQSVRKHQYWSKEGEHWKIVAEANL